MKKTIQILLHATFGVVFLFATAYSGNLTNLQTPASQLTVRVTFENIGYECTFAEDDNGNNDAVVQYKKTSNSTWETVASNNTHPRVYIDRRTTVRDGSGGTTSNEFYNTVRGSITGLERNTAYDVKIIFIDPDGFIGGSEIISTNNLTWSHDNPNTSGGIYYVSTTGSDGNDGSGSCSNGWAAFSTALSNVSAGDTIRICPGIYSETLNIQKNGTASNYLKLEASDINNKPVISNLATLEGEYVWIDGLQFNGGLRFRNGVEYSVVSNSIFMDDAMQLISGSTVGLLIENNTIILGTEWGDPKRDTGVYIEAEIPEPSRVVIRNNVMTGGRDGVGGSANKYPHAGFSDSDIYDNEISQWFDDAIEVEGNNVNVRVYNNYLHDYQGGPGVIFGMAGVTVGPLYLFNNITYNGTTTFKSGNAASDAGPVDGQTYIIHNTIWSSKKIFLDQYAGQRNVHVVNNVFHLGPSGTTFVEVKREREGWLFDGNNYDEGSSRQSDAWKLGDEIYNNLSSWNNDAMVADDISVQSSYENIPTDPYLKQESTILNSEDANSDVVIKFDYYGNKRPKGEGYDIGAVEYPKPLAPRNFQLN